MRSTLYVLALCVITACSGSSNEPAKEVSTPTTSPVDQPSLHQSLTVYDSHLDIPAAFHSSDYDFSKRGSYETDGTQVDLPRMNEGGLDGGFWVIYTPQGPLAAPAYQAARKHALQRQLAIRELAAKYSENVELAFTADDAERIISNNKKVIFQSMENAYPLGSDLSMLEVFYASGLRMIGPVHFRDNQFADSATDISKTHNGLSALGKELIREANRLGLIVDGSHASDKAVEDMIALSTTPLILSHSGPDGVYEHPRNLPDDLIIKLAESGGVIQVNALGAYLEKLEPTQERAAGLIAIEEQFGNDFASMPPETAAEYRAALENLNENHPAPRSSFEKFMEHLLYTLQLVGAEHVGIGADWDGGGGVEGMSDITDLPKITDALLEAGYSEEDLKNIWGGNMMRLMRNAEAARTADLVSHGIVN